MNEVTVKVYGKVNLSLKVCKKAEAYHILDTVMASISVFDVVFVSRKATGFTVTFDGTVDGKNSNAMKAALLMKDAFNIGGADINITTGIPSGAGLGGSSADAAGVIRGLAKLYGISATETKLTEIAAKVGSDVPYMLDGGYARLVGTASGVRHFTAPCGQKILLAGMGEVNTGECFRAFDHGKIADTRPDNDELICDLTAGNFDKSALNFINELQPYAIKLNDNVEKTLKIMKANGLTACMTGSGAYSFGLGNGTALKTAETELKANKINAVLAEIVPCGIEYIKK